MQLTRRRAARLTPLAVLSALALAGCHSGAGGGGDTSAPTIGGGAGGAAATLTTPKNNTLTLSQADFLTQLQAYVPNSGGQSFAPIGQPAGRLVMQQLLQALMLEGLAQDQGVAPTDAEVDTGYNNFKTVQEARSVKPLDQALADAGLSAQTIKDLQIRPQLAQLKLLTKGATVSDADIQSFYNANKDKQFVKPARVHIKRLVFATLPEAQAAAKAIAGGQTFESQAAQSLDKSSPDGDVPQWVPLDPAPANLAALIKPIKATQPGQVTPPITLPGPGGRSTYWLVKVVERKDKETVPLDQVKDLIRSQLLQQKAAADPAVQQNLQQSLHDFQTQAKISVPGTQYASLVQELTHPAPLPPAAGAGGGALPFAPTPGRP